ncbi:hypothetical protein GYMLUDRAFT_967365 [Collybiopsis luxurians FD-317 M1]|uniref:DNA 3'-5' helicase n=1 Tax=Collybiopsis luxurians FD-317 M1 TaxID=944289 RepID=A0A0D0CBW6_9AGAR|nr:hypothetical protein GYMLUDRAFT_967365 [Collybiopsis luxurians FD-317 M1]
MNFKPFRLAEEEPDGEELPDPDEIPPDIESAIAPLEDQDANLTRQYLHGYGISVDPVYNLIVCLECNGIADFHNIMSHKKRSHSKKSSPTLRFPPPEKILPAIAALGGSRPRRPDPLQGPIEPIYGVEVLPGFKCAMPGCSGKVFYSRNVFRKHQAGTHPDIQPKARKFAHVQCQPLSIWFVSRKYIEVLQPAEDLAFDGWEQLQKVADECRLFEAEEHFSVAESKRERGIVFSLTHWDELITNAHVSLLQKTASVSEHSDREPFRLLKSLTKEYYREIASDLSRLPVLTRRYILDPGPSKPGNKPFEKPQRSSTTDRNSNTLAQFLSFLILHQLAPVDSFPVILHPQVRSCLLDLYTELGLDRLSRMELKKKIHKVIWTLLSLPSDEFKRQDTMCPLTRFLIACHLQEGGSFAKARVITPTIARIQWCLRATGAQETMIRRNNFNGDSLLAFQTEVGRWISESEACIFNSLRQNMHFLSTIAFNEQGVSRFVWSHDRKILGVDGFPIHIPSFVEALTSTVSVVTEQIAKLFRGCNFLDILDRIDQSMVPDETGRPRWFMDKINCDDMRYSFLEEDGNGLREFRPRLIRYLVNHSKLFKRAGGRLILDRKHSQQWFSELDDIVRGLYYLIVTTWGGGARGTEMVDLLYANHPQNGRRQAFFINGLFTIVTEYSKTQSIKGTGETTARTPAYQVTRLLILVIGVAYYAAGYIGCYLGMEKYECSRYFYELFVCSGHSMKSTHFSNTLGEFNIITTGIDLRLTDFRQFMACLLISSTSSSFVDLEDEDPQVVDAHRSFNHSVMTGRAHYGREQVAGAISLAPDAVARMQEVSLRWQAFLRLIHPVILSKMQSEEEDEHVANSRETNDMIKSLCGSLVDDVSRRLDEIESRQKLLITQMFDSVGMRLTERKYAGDTPPLYQNTRRIPVQPGTALALRSVVKDRFARWKSVEQAELVNSVGSTLHVFGVLEAGAGKSLAFLGAPLLIPAKVFLIIGGIAILTENIRRHLAEVGIKAGVYGQDQLDASTVELVFVSAQEAGTENFYHWATSSGFRVRLFRIFINECHKILTDETYHRCLQVIQQLTARGVPVTFLSGSLMPRTMPFILEKLNITDPLLVDEIRRYTGQPKLKYMVERVASKEDLLDRIKHLVGQETEIMTGRQRGIVYASSLALAKSITDMLGCSLYGSVLGRIGKEDAESAWHNGASPWIVATEPVGNGAQYPHVRTTIHANPRELLDWAHETSQAGRDNTTSLCFTLWNELPPAIPAEEPDHKGRMEMRALLRTSNCIRLACSSLEREAHSCNAINGELCSNCENNFKIPYHLSAHGFPRIN